MTSFNREPLGVGDAQRVELSLAIHVAIYGLPREQRDALEALMDQVRNGQKANYRELAAKLNIPYSVYYAHLNEGLRGLGRKLAEDPNIRDWLEATQQTEHGENIASRVAKLL